MQPELKLYLCDTLAAGPDILRFLNDVSLAKYRESELLRPAVERKFLEQVPKILATLRQEGAASKSELRLLW